MNPDGPGEASSSNNSNSNSQTRNSNFNWNWNSDPQRQGTFQHNISGSFNSAWNLHPSFYANSNQNQNQNSSCSSNANANLNTGIHSGPRNDSNSWSRASYRPGPSNLSWNRDAKLDKGKGKAKASNEPASISRFPNQVRPRPPPIRPIPSRSEDLQPNEMKTDFIYRNFIEKNHPPTVKSSAFIPKSKLSSSAASSSSRGFSSSNPITIPSGPRNPSSSNPIAIPSGPRSKLPNKIQLPSRSNNNKSLRGSDSHSSTSNLVEGIEPYSSSEPRFIDVDAPFGENQGDMGRNSEGNSKEKWKDKKTSNKNKKQKIKGNGKGTSEVNSEEKLSKGARSRRNKPIRKAEANKDPSGPQVDDVIISSSNSVFFTNSNRTSLPENRWNKSNSNSTTTIDITSNHSSSRPNHPGELVNSNSAIDTSTRPEDRRIMAEEIVEIPHESASRNVVEEESQDQSSLNNQNQGTKHQKNLKRKASFSPLPVDEPPPSRFGSNERPNQPSSTTSAPGDLGSKNNLKEEDRSIKPSPITSTFSSDSFNRDSIGSSTSQNTKETSISTTSNAPGNTSSSQQKSLPENVDRRSEINIGMGMESCEVGNCWSRRENLFERQNHNPSSQPQSSQINGSKDSSSLASSSSKSTSLSTVKITQNSLPKPRPTMVATNSRKAAPQSQLSKFPKVTPVLRPPPRRENNPISTPSSSSRDEDFEMLSDQAASRTQSSLLRAKQEPIDVDQIGTRDVIVLDSDSEADDDLPLVPIKHRTSDPGPNVLGLLLSMGAFDSNLSKEANPSPSNEERIKTLPAQSTKPVKSKMKIVGFGETRTSAKLDPSHHPRFLLPISSKGYQDRSGKDFDSLIVLSKWGQGSSSRSNAKFFGQPSSIFFNSNHFNNKIEDIQRVSSRTVAVASSCQQAVHGEQPSQLSLLFVRDPLNRDPNPDLDGTQRKWNATDELELSPIKHLNSKPHTFGASCLSLFPSDRIEEDSLEGEINSNSGSSGDLDLATGGSDGVIFRWTFVSKSRSSGTLPQDKVTRVHALHVSNSSTKSGVKALTEIRKLNSLISAGADGRILIYDVDKQMEKSSWKTSDNIVSLKKCPSPHLFMSAQSRLNYDQFKCFDVRQGNKISKPALSFGWQSSLNSPNNLGKGSFNPIFKSLYSHPSSEGIVRIWDLRMPKQDSLEIVISSEKEVYDTIWASDGKEFLSLCSDGIRKTEVIMGAVD